MRRCVGQLAIELRRPDVHAVEQRAAFEMKCQWHDGDRPAFRQLRWQVRGRVRDDRDPALGHSFGSTGCGSLKRRFLRPLKNRSSMGLSATRTTTTSTAVKTATL